MLKILLVLFVPLVVFGTPVVDSRGKVLDLPQAPQRIISGTLASDEILYALLSEAKALQRLLAVSTIAEQKEYSNIPSEVKSIKGRVGTSDEGLVALKPDLALLATYNRPELVHNIESLKIPTFVMGGFARFDDIKSNITTIGALIHMRDGAERLVSSMEQGITQVKKRYAGREPRTLPTVVCWYPDGTLVGKDTTIDDIIRYAGGRNLLAERGIAGWSKISAEFAIELDPDFILTAGEENDIAPALNLLATDPVWSKKRAVLGRSVIVVPSKLLGSVSQYVVGAVELVGKRLHPTGPVVLKEPAQPKGMGERGPVISTEKAAQGIPKKSPPPKGSLR